MPCGYHRACAWEPFILSNLLWGLGYIEGASFLEYKIGVHIGAGKEGRVKLGPLEAILV